MKAALLCLFAFCLVLFTFAALASRADQQSFERELQRAYLLGRQAAAIEAKKHCAGFWF